MGTGGATALLSPEKKVDGRELIVERRLLRFATLVSGDRVFFVKEQLTIN
jgi:hypothetical protein